MHYKFPIINTIDDVLPAIEGNDEFIILDKGDYKIIDYLVNGSHTFPKVFNGTYDANDKKNALKRECRGLAFYPDGKIMSRPFHKFFNYGEKPEEQENLGTPACVLQKMDGSMIRPLLINGHIRLGTRKGITDVAMQAEEFIADKQHYLDFMLSYMAVGKTPIFEWCSRKNQIILDYPEDQLVLLAIRDNTTGIYISTESNGFIPVVKSLNEENPFKSGKELTDEEGYVIVYETGHRLKVKSDWYVTLHRAKELIGREKDLIKLYLDNNIDDVLPLLPAKDRLEVVDFLTGLTDEVVKTAKHLDDIFVSIITKLPDSFTRKDFALEVANKHPKYKSLLFSMLPGTNTLELLFQTLKKATCNNKKLEEFRWLFGNLKFKEAKILS